MPEEFRYTYRVQSITPSAGLTDVEFPLHGEKIIYAAPTTGPELSIRLQSSHHDAIPLRPEGVIVAPFTRFYVSCGAAATTIYLLVAAPKDIDLINRAPGGGGGSSVRPLEEEAFISQTMYRRSGAVAAVAGQNGHAQVFNPVGSGKTVRVLAVSFTSTGTNMRAHIGHYNTALGTLVGTLQNIDNSLANSAAEVRTTTNAGLLFAPDLHELGNSINVRYEEQFLAILSPGYGLCLACDLVNFSFVYSFTIQEF